MTTRTLARRLKVAVSLLVGAVVGAGALSSAACSAPSVVTRPSLRPNLTVDTTGFTARSIVVIGDSLSDLGALKAATLNVVPNSAYFDGRFSNGLV